MHNLARAGVRIMSRERFETILEPYREDLGKRNFQLMARAASDVLNHALCVIGDELYDGRHFTLLSKRFRQWRK